MNTTYIYKTIKRIKICIWIIITGLALSGLTAFPIETELSLLIKHSTAYPAVMQNWLNQIYHAVKTTNQTYPYLSYGTDWLAFAHLMLALLFIGPLKQPLKNKWVIQFGMIACIAIFPLAFIAGGIRGIPLFWRLIDCSFGLLGIIPLLIASIMINKLENTIYKGL
ncbi:hypothetical protein BDD43_2607 [Mucilaginibacter gracilis]|uniref:Uncharacterized protein n=1 Tax=Mucilaginibacter gracilis TaxID=423350 RepID=A0A495J0H2_9SPHI|nr:hypothetical protein [Mucilaginibacter gracilis]RKR82427.1 hypothetical protein BDD43_2607 [Mucilaginibacter gracilis]